MFLTFALVRLSAHLSSRLSLAGLPETWRGLGVQIEYHGPVRLVGHGGTFPGFDAAAYTCPETARSAAILANTNTGLLRDQLRKALRPAG